MAGLNLLPRRKFEITLSDGTIIPGQFNTFALDLFARRRNNATLSEISNFFVKEKKNPDGTTFLDSEGNPVIELTTTIHDIADYILCACESAARLAGKPFTLTDVQLLNWADEYTYDTGEAGTLGKLYAHSASVDQKKSEETQVIQ